MHIYFSGIGGSGLSALAHIARDAGYTVSGSDLAHNQNTEQLSARGVHVAICQDGSQIEAAHKRQSIDWVVVSSAIPTRHPERSFASENNIRLTKREDFINYILKEFNLELIAVSGTHGKTTTTAMFAWIMLRLDQPISWVIGTNVAFGKSGHLDKTSDYLVLEADEYDRHMLNYTPRVTLIPSLDYDHPDIYPTREDYYVAFNALLKQSEQSILWESDAQELTLTDSTTSLPEDHPLHSVPLPGIHNRKNAALVAAGLTKLKIIGQAEEVYATFKDFPGTQRRFEKLADNLYTDYAHHPVEIKATLQLARELQEQQHYNQLVVIYQPHQNSRQYEVQSDYPEAFTQADKVYWLPTYLSREDPTLDTLTPEHFVKLLGKDKAFTAHLNEELIAAIREEQETNNLVVLMGAGSIDPWIRTRAT